MPLYILSVVVATILGALGFWPVALFAAAFAVIVAFRYELRQSLPKKTPARVPASERTL